MVSILLLFVCNIFILNSNHVFATDDEGVWKFEVTLPQFVEDFLFDGAKLRNRNSESDEDRDIFRFKISGPGVDVLQKIFHGTSRKSIQVPGTEVGPGAFKSDIVTYPPDKFINDLKKLIKIKEKLESNKT